MAKNVVPHTSAQAENASGGRDWRFIRTVWQPNKLRIATLRLYLSLVIPLVMACGRPVVSWSDRCEKAEQSVRAALKQTNVAAPGAIVEVTTSNHTWRFACGYSDGKGTPMNADMSFRIASITKTFTAAMAVELGQMHMLGIHRLASTFLPNPDPKRFPYWNQITIQQLANHTSGITELTDSPEFQAVQNRDPLHHWKSDELLRLVHQNVKPGERYQYANSNFLVLGLVIEKLTGMRFGAFLDSELFKPIKLNHTTFVDQDHRVSPKCRGFSGKTDVTVHDPSWAWGAGNMISTASDLTRWLRTLLGSKWFSEEFKESLLSTNAVSGSVGLGIENYKGWLGHTGRIEGYSSAAFYNPDLDATVVVMVNRMDPSDPSEDPRNNLAREIPVLNAVVNAFFPSSPTGLVSGHT